MGYLYSLPDVLNHGAIILTFSTLTQYPLDKSTPELISIAIDVGALELQPSPTN